MRGFVISVVFSIVLLFSFLYGLFTQSSPFMIAGFCLWTPAMITLGYTAARNGVRLVIGSAPEPMSNGALPPQFAPRKSRINSVKPERTA